MTIWYDNQRGRLLTITTQVQIGSVKVDIIQARAFEMFDRYSDAVHVPTTCRTVRLGFLLQLTESSAQGAIPIDTFTSLRAGLGG